MKILDRYILISFISTFLTVFVILFLIFILQTVWLFIGELAGKNLDLILIVKFLAFKMPSIVPLVLPLSVVLASIMTFGSFAENYEFAAMKSAGISLQRAMRGLSVFIAVLAVASFAFANNVIPYAEYKFINFRRNIAQIKPAMAIAEGQFNEVGEYNIKVDRKSGENDNFLHGVTIHKKSSRDFGKNTVVIKAKDGELVSNQDSNFLQLILKDGNYYEDIYTNSLSQQDNLPFAKSSFEKYTINIDLSKLNNSNTNTEEITNTNTMLNVAELQYTIDSLKTNFEMENRSFSDNIYQRVLVKSNRKPVAPQPAVSLKQDVPEDLLSIFSPTEKYDVLRSAASHVSNTRFSIESAMMDMEARQKNLNNHYIAFYDKFVIAFSCFLMFFIGAPLGAIIRKGGLGMPIVFAILVFIIFHFANTFGRKLAQENGIPPFFGSWLSTIILAPLAVTLTHRATNDKQVSISFDWLMVPFRKMFGKRKAFNADAEKERIVNLAAMQIPVDEDWNRMMQLSDQQLADSVFDARKLGMTEKARLQALKILETRGITQDDLLQQNRLYNRDYEHLTELKEGYRLDSNLSLILFFIAVALIAVVQNNTKLLWLVIPTFVVVAGFYTSLYNTMNRLKAISMLTNRKIGANKYLVLITGIPLYFIFYFLNRRALNAALKETDV